MTEEKLKLILTNIKKNNYVINDDVSYYSYALDMLKYIGSTDAVLRDDLIYDIFSKWIIQNCFSFDELQELLAICIDDQHLMYCLGKQNDDSVFTRTFSALVIALILYSHNQNAFLSSDTIHKAKNILIDYYSKEVDYRGYIDTKGWAHSVAHGADAIDELAQCSSICKDDLLNLLMAIKLKICQGCYVYIDGESDRISIAAKSIFMRDEIDKSDVFSWLSSFEVYSCRYNQSIEWYHQSVNITNFLKSLYFSLIDCHFEFDILYKIKDLIAFI